MTTAPSNVIYLATRRDPWAVDGDDVRWVDGYRDAWLAVLRLSLEDYWRGIRKGQHLKLREIRLIHRGRHDADDFADWLAAAHWLLSDDTRPRSFCWLMAILQLEPDVVRSRMNNPPVRCVPAMEEE